MYRVPLDLDLSKLVGEFTTQVRVGQFDIQFTFGPVNFAIQSPVQLIKDGQVVGRWEKGRWPEPGFFEVMNSAVSRWKIPDDKTIIIYLENGIELHLQDSSDQYESMQISVEGNPVQVII